MKAECFFLFAQVEQQEQGLVLPAKSQLVAQAFVQVVAYEERNSERPFPSVLPRANRARELGPDWLELEFACDLAEPYERRSRADAVLAVTRDLKGHVRLFKGAFAYFAPDDLRPVETLDTTAFTALG